MTTNRFTKTILLQTCLFLAACDSPAPKRDLGVPPGGKADCVGSCGILADDIQETRTLYRRDGSMELFLWYQDPHNDFPQLSRYQPTDQRLVTTAMEFGAHSAHHYSDPERFHPEGDFAEGPDGRLFYAGTSRTLGSSGAWRHRVEFVLDVDSDTPQKHDVLIRTGDVYNRKAIGQPKMAVGPQGRVFIAFGHHYVTVDHPSGGQQTLNPGISVLVCDQPTRSSPCQVHQIMAMPQAASSRLDISVVDAVPTLVVQGPQQSERGSMHIFRMGGQSWQEGPPIEYPGELHPQFASGGDRTVLSLQTWATYTDPRDTILLEAEGSSFTELATLPWLTLPELQMRFTSDGYLTLLAGRLSRTFGGRDLWYLYDERNDFAPQRFQDRTGRGLAILQSDGGARSFRFFPDQGFLMEDYEGAPHFVEMVQPNLETLGAGQLTPRDPCVRGHERYQWTGQLGRIGLKPGVCIVDASLRTAHQTTVSDPEQPIHLVGSYVKLEPHTTLSQAFFEDSTLKAISYGGTVPVVEHSTFWGTPKEVMVGAQYTDTMIVADRIVIDEDAPQTKILRLALRNIAAGPVDGAFIAGGGSTELTLEDSVLEDVPVGIVFHHEGVGTGQLTVRNVVMREVDVAIHVLYDIENVRALFLRDSQTPEDNPLVARMRDVHPMPIVVENLHASGPGRELRSGQMPLLARGERPWDYDVLGVRTMVRLERTTGEIRHTILSNGEGSGVLLHHSDLFDISSTQISGFAHSGVHVTATPPSGLGPDCVIAPPGGQRVTFFYPDPIVRDSYIGENGHVGVDVEYPFIPVQIENNQIIGNGVGVRFENAAFESPGGERDGCWRVPATLDSPLSDETFIHLNNFVDNASALESLHLHGALNATDNFWSQPDGVSCITAGACLTDPALTLPNASAGCPDDSCQGN